LTLVEVRQDQDRLSYRQRWGHYFALIFGVIAFAIGVNLRDSALNATTLYSNSQAGLRVRYPENWLIDEGGADYVFRIQDATEIGYKTTIQVAIRPVSPTTTARNVLDTLSLGRAPTLAAYNVLSIEPYVLPDETEAVALNYPFSKAFPPSLQGRIF
jgi:hypothetical protein